MGILRNLVNAKVSGNVGSMNFRKRGSQTVVAERSYSNSSKGEGASAAQRAHRSRLANIVNFYRVIAAIEARAWQNKPENTSDFNMLSKYNLAASPVFLTKQESLSRACVIAPYEVSRGSLESLAQSFETDGFNVGVKLDPSFNITQNTLGDFSQQVLDNNSGWLNGDKLSIALLTHAIVPVASLAVPKVEVVYVEITLDIESPQPMLAITNLAAAAVKLNAEGYICCGYACNGAFAIHSRKVNGVLETSSQSVIMPTTADAVYVKYTSEVQKEMAMASYGYQADVLLTPGNVAEPTAADIKIAVVNGITYNNAVLAAGSTIQGGNTLVIEGTDFTSKNVVVSVAGVNYVPQVATDVRREYTLSRGGQLIIMVNNSPYLTATVEAAPSGVTSIKWGANTYTAPQSNLTAAPNSSIALEVSGADLGNITGTGCQLSNVGGSATKRTATVKIGANGTTWTVSCGTEVILSGLSYNNPEQEL